MAFAGDHTLVFDVGSKFTKAGFAGEYFPRASVPSVVGRFRNQSLIDGTYPLIYFGSEALRNRGISSLTWPVQNGVITNWDDAEKLWFHVFFKELHTPPEQCRVLHSVSPLVSKGDRERMAEIFFETFAITGLNLIKSPVLALHASGRTTGVVYESGASSSVVTPIFEGFPLLHNVLSPELTGDAVTKKLGKALAERGYSFTTPRELDIVDSIKAEMCFTAVDYKDECDRYAAAGENPVKYELPDGQHVLLGAERFQCCEALFQPSLAGLACPSVVDYICKSIQNCDTDVRAQMYHNVVISGGASQFPGFGTRLFLELKSRVKNPVVDESITVLVDELPTPQNASWIGGAMIASMDSMNGFWMTKAEYDDVGADRINYKFY